MELELWKESLREEESPLTDCSSQSISSESLLRRVSASSSEKVNPVPGCSSSGSKSGKAVSGSSLNESERVKRMMAMLSFNTERDEIARAADLINPAPGIN